MLRVDDEWVERLLGVGTGFCQLGVGHGITLCPPNAGCCDKAHLQHSPSRQPLDTLTPESIHHFLLQERLTRLVARPQNSAAGAGDAYQLAHAALRGLTCFRIVPPLEFSASFRS